MMSLFPLSLKEVPAIGMGTWYMGEDPDKRSQEIKALQTGIEHGLTLIDTAEMYGDGLAEELVGEAIKPYDRSQLALVTKVYPWNASGDKMRLSLEHSLRRLQTDYVDLYLLHWREDTPLEETIEMFEQLKAEGKLRAWGVSNFDAADMKELETISANCATNQVLYNMSNRGIEFDLLPWMRERQMPLMAYTPLGHGDTLKANFTKNPILLEIAAQHKCSVYQILLAWCIRAGDVIAVPKSGNPEHVKANARALEIKLNDEELNLIEAIFPRPLHKTPLEVL
ncbi:aldo/keto reductase [Lysinibacillus sp. 3P01SB]|uniref:aldo/keto reductase n=1 Tax=Lysinibacillus sp. 3P01SB TaxID=3132284 RepID=UPI0039A497A7